MEASVLLTAAIMISEPFVRSSFNETPVESGGPLDDLILRGYEFDCFAKIFEEVLQFRFSYGQFTTSADMITNLTAGEVDIIVNVQPAATYFSINNRSDDIRMSQLFSMTALLVCIGFTMVTVTINKFDKKYLQESAFIQVIWILIVTCLLGLFTNLMAVRLVIPNKTTKPY